MTTLERQMDQNALSAAELADLMEAYQKATERLQAAHGELQREVAGLHEELAAKNAELARKERLTAVGQMAAGVAHEIRNPLGAIRLFAGTLRRELSRAEREDRAPATERVLGYTEKIVRAVSSMDRIVGDMLNLARTREPALLPCDLASVIDRALDAAAQDLHRHQVTVDRGDPSSLPSVPSLRVQADTDQLSRAFLNIITNAAQAMGGGGRLHVAASLVNGRVRVRFTDSGPGIDPAHLDRIFEPFFTCRDGGTGLGLALAYRIVESHHGRLWARNEARGGATFIVELPAVKGC